MKHAAMVFLIAGATITQPVGAVGKDNKVLGNWAPIRAYYLIHGGGTAYPEPPTQADQVLTVLIEGKAAKEVFERIGPDAKVTCSSENGDRERRNKGVACAYTALLNDPKDFHYRCWLGINLKNGDGDIRVAC